MSFAYLNATKRLGAGSLDQVKALEREMLMRIERAGLDFEPRIIIVTRLIPVRLSDRCVTCFTSDRGLFLMSSIDKFHDHGSQTWLN